MPSKLCLRLSLVVVAVVASTADDNSDRALARPPVGSTGVARTELRERVPATAVAPQPHGTIIFSSASTGGGARLIEVDAGGGHRDEMTRAADPAAHDISPAWSEQSRLLAFLRLAHGTISLIVADADGTVQRSILIGPIPSPSGQVSNFPLAPQWSPDGRKIVVEQNLVHRSGVVAPKSQIVLVDPRRGTKRVLARGSNPTFLGNGRVAFLRVRWHLEDVGMGNLQEFRPNGAQLLTLATAGGPPRLLHSTDTDRPPSKINAQRYDGAVGSPDGKRVALSVGDDQGSPKDLLLVDRRGQVQWPTGGFAGPTAIAWSPAGDRLALEESSHLLLSDERQQHELPVPAPGADPPQIRAVAWSPDGRFLAALSCPVLSSRCDLSRLRLGEAHWRLLTHLYLREEDRSTLTWRR